MALGVRAARRDEMFHREFGAGGILERYDQKPGRGDAIQNCALDVVWMLPDIHQEGKGTVRDSVQYDLRIAECRPYVIEIVGRDGRVIETQVRIDRQAVAAG